MRKQIGFTALATAALLLATAPVVAVTLDLGGGGGVLGGGTGGGILGGAGSSDSDVGVNLGGDDDNEVDINLLGRSSSDADATVDLDDTLGTGGDTNANLRLFGAPAGTSTATVNLGGDEQDDVILNLFGAPGGGDSTTASANILSGSGLGTGGIAGDDTSVALDLFGTGGGDDGVDPTTTGSTSTDGGGAGGNGGAGGAFTPAAPGGIGAQPINARPGGNANLRVATTGSTGGCFAPDQQQINNLLNRTSYSIAVTGSWEAADNVKLVPINLCEASRADIAAALAADPNIDALHAAVTADADISGALNPQYDADDVLAVDKTGEDLTVYVY